MTRLHIVRSGSGVPLVMIHGMGTSAATWDACRPLLDDEFEVIAVDLIGHGSSPVPDDAAEFTRDRTLIDLDDIVVDLARPPVLVGHSLGGYLSLAYAATRPGAVSGIVVLNTGPGFRDPVKREEWNARSRRNAHRFGVPERVADLNLQEDSVVMDRVAEMETPTLVLAGSADRPEYISSGEYLARKMPNAQVHVIEGGSHLMHEERQAAEVASAIRKFVHSLKT